jgi:hypothetical protein
MDALNGSQEGLQFHLSRPIGAITYCIIDGLLAPQGDVTDSFPEVDSFRHSTLVEHIRAVACSGSVPQVFCLLAAQLLQLPDPSIFRCYLGVFGNNRAVFLAASHHSIENASITFSDISLNSRGLGFECKQKYSPRLDKFIDARVGSTQFLAQVPDLACLAPHPARHLKLKRAAENPGHFNEIQR